MTDAAPDITDEDAVTLEALPYECLVECLVPLDTAADLATVACVSHALKDAAEADFLWRNLCVKQQHGQALDFRNALGTFGHPDAKPLDDREQPAASTTNSGSEVGWRSGVTTSARWAALRTCLTAVASRLQP